jgi:hypothetical protein
MRKVWHHPMTKKNQQRVLEVLAEVGNRKFR